MPLVGPRGCRTVSWPGGRLMTRWFPILTLVYYDQTVRKLDSYAAVEHPLRLALRASDSRRALKGDYFTVAEDMGTEDLTFSNSHLFAIARILVALPGRCRFGSSLRTPILGRCARFVKRHCLQSTDCRVRLRYAGISGRWLALGGIRAAVIVGGASQSIDNRYGVGRNSPRDIELLIFLPQPWANGL